MVKHSPTYSKLINLKYEYLEKKMFCVPILNPK